MLKYPYIVDIGLSTFRPSKFNSKSSSGQELFCRCGGRLKYQQKVKREILIVNVPVYQADYDLEAISCPYCNEIYDEKNKINILEPNTGSLMEVSFFTKKHTLEDGSKVWRLVKQRFYAYYDEKLPQNGVKEILVYDEISFNYNTGELSIFIDNSNFKDTYTGIIIKSVLETDKEGQEPFLEQNISNQISFYTLDKVKQFFTFNSEIIYNNLESCFEYLKEIGENQIDFDKLKKSEYTYISTFWEEYKIHLEKIDKKNTFEYKRYRFVEDEFSATNEKVKMEFHSGSYLNSLYTIAISIFSLQLYPSLITIFLTKNFKFFDSFIKSDTIVNPNVFKFHGATYPAKIIEIAANYTRTGSKKVLNSKFSQRIEDKQNEVKQTENEYLQISNLIFKKISQEKDINKLKAFYEKNYLTKLQLEQLYQKYSENDLYSVFGFLGESDKRDVLEFRHIEHIIKYKLYKDIGSDFINVYCDTIKILKDIVRTQPTVIKHINSNVSISTKEKESLSVYLTIKESDVFEKKSGNDLKKFHDNLSILFSVFQDAAKVEAYANAIEKFENINVDIDFYQFEIIPSAYELQREHKVMKHCINTYIDRIIRGNYLAVRVVDRISNEHSTLGINVDYKNLKFDQLKSYQNSRSSPYLINAVMKFFTYAKIDSSNGSAWDLKPDGEKSMRDSRKEVLALDKCQKFRMKLLAIQASEEKKKEDERLKPEDYIEKIIEFQAKLTKEEEKSKTK